MSSVLDIFLMRKYIWYFTTMTLLIKISSLLCVNISVCLFVYIDIHIHIVYIDVHIPLHRCICGQCYGLLLLKEKSDLSLLVINTMYFTFF